jgi:hypothetical protein
MHACAREGRDARPDETMTGDSDELLQCAECRSGEHVNIRGGRAGTWIASCAGCGSEWDLAE